MRKKDSKGVELDTDPERRGPQAHRRSVQSPGGKRNWASPFRKMCRSNYGAAIGAVFGSWGKPARQHLSQAAQHSGGLGHGGDGAGNGIRQPGRNLGHRRCLHPRPRHRRKAALWRIPDQRAGRGCGGGHPHAAAHFQSRARAPGRQEAQHGRGDAHGFRRTERHRRAIGAALSRHAGCGIHGAGRQALHAPDPLGQAHRGRGAESGGGHGQGRPD